MPDPREDIEQSVVCAALSEVLVKLDQNVPNLLCRDIRLVQLGIDRHKDDVCRCLEVIDHAIARMFAFLNVTVPHSYLEYGVARSGHFGRR